MRPRCGHCSRILVLAFVASLFAACATSPPRRDETTAILEIREDYLRTHPDGPFNGEISRGEVVSGMDYHDVLASWGMPDARSADSERREERWTYVLRSDNGVDWVRYDFVFVRQVMVEWEFSREVGSGFVSARDDNRGVSNRVPPSSISTTGETVRKGSRSMIR